MVSPSGNDSGILLVRDGLESTLSVTVTTPSDTPESTVRILVASAVTSSGIISDGGSLSCTVTIKDASAKFPEESVAVNVMVLFPNGNGSPDEIPAVWVIVTLPERSVAVVSSKNTIAVDSDSSVFVIISDGGIIVGGVVSIMLAVLFT